MQFGKSKARVTLDEKNRVTFDDVMLKKATPASPATARASKVFPVPGGPYSNTPFGILAPISLNFFGIFRPDVKVREEILKVHVRKKPLASDVDLAVIAKQTAGFTGADLANLVNEAALLSWYW